MGIMTDPIPHAKDVKRLEISRVVGNMGVNLRGLSASVAEVERSSAEHHRETRERPESIAHGSRRSSPT